ncbi:hypothetical protein BGW80DRAFT_1249090 [Lactifluus volemus]|nr:hypothetical protein BGW80DRAFT_1249090 [Lactifluus volemus]
MAGSVIDSWKIQASIIMGHIVLRLSAGHVSCSESAESSMPVLESRIDLRGAAEGTSASLGALGYQRGGATTAERNQEVHVAFLRGRWALNENNIKMAKITNLSPPARETEGVARGWETACGVRVRGDKNIHKGLNNYWVPCAEEIASLGLGTMSVLVAPPCKLPVNFIRQIEQEEWLIV